MDLPPAHYYELVIEQKLVACGLNRAGLAIAYSDLLQSIEIVIGPEAEPNAEQFQCIHDAAANEIVTFEDRELYRAYSEFTTELARPMLLEMARKALSERGLLDDFPERKDFASDDAFAEALETHCSIEPRSAIGRTEFGLQLLPDGMPSSPLKGKRWDHYSCLLSALSYLWAKGDEFKVHIVGNEAVSEPDDN